MLILLNAVYFKGNWKTKFNEKLTVLEPFYTSKTTTVDVPMMHIVDKFYYKQLDEINADCIALPYKVCIFPLNLI
jgi:serine protease inhibitor